MIPSLASLYYLAQFVFLLITGDVLGLTKVKKSVIVSCIFFYIKERKGRPGVLVLLFGNYVYLLHVKL